jgi:hypothetical protein
MAEGACAVLTGQCLARRLPQSAALGQESAAWQAARHHSKTTINWRLSTTDARSIRKRLYPSAPGGEWLPEMRCMRAA